jgi:hypothetical protein
VTYATIRRLSILVVPILLVGACSTGGTTPTGGPSVPPAGTAAVATPAATPATTTSATDAATPDAATPGATAAATPAATSDVATPAATTGGSGDLASIIPAEVGGIAAEIRSYTGQEYVDLVGGGSPETEQMLLDQFTALGSTVEDVSVAGGDYYSDDNYVRISALRLAGADPATLIDTWVQNLIDSAPEFNSGMSASAEDATVGGKPVKVVTTMLGGSVYDVQYVYGLGDTIVTVVGGSDELIAEALGLLP